MGPQPKPSTSHKTIMSPSKLTQIFQAKNIIINKCFKTTALVHFSQSYDYPTWDFLSPKDVNEKANFETKSDLFWYELERIHCDIIPCG